jgi:hypothetical protein
MQRVRIHVCECLCLQNINHMSKFGLFTIEYMFFLCGVRFCGEHGFDIKSECLLNAIRI